MKECPDCYLCFGDEYDRCPNDGQALFTSHKCAPLLSDRYILEKRLGKGGMGTVFKAKHKLLKSSHAIKIISPEVVKEDASLLIRFKQEAILAASIHHPNVISVTDFGVENEDTPYLVMEFIEGISLDEFLRKEKRLSPDKALEILRPIALGVGEAHSKGITHRDLKPLNVMLKNGQTVSHAIKVLDFGLAKMKSTEAFASLVQAKTTNLLGSPTYMSPEQWSNGGIDNRTDIYSLGVIAFQLLSGTVPFKGDSVAHVMYQHLQIPPPSFASLKLSIKPEIESVLRKALAKEKDDRFATVEDFLSEYENALSSSNTQIISKLDSNINTNPLHNRTSVVEDQLSTTEAYSSVDLNKTYELTYLSLSQNQTLSTYFNQSKLLESEKTQKLAKEFIDAQNRVEEAHSKVIESEKLVQEFKEAQKAAEDAQYKALQAQKKLEEQIQQLAKDEAKKKQAVEEQGFQQIKEQASRLEKQALEAEQKANEARLLAENEAQKRQAADAARIKAEEEARRLAEEIIVAQRQLEEAHLQVKSESEKRTLEEARKRVENSAPSFSKSESNAVNNSKNLQTESNLIKNSTQALPVETLPELQNAISGGVNTFSPGISNTNQISVRRGFSPVFLGSGLLAFLLLSTFVGYMIYQPSVNSTSTGNFAVNSNEKGLSPIEASNLPSRIREKMVKITGGTFQMGRSDVTSLVKDYGVQFPAHTVSVDSFYIDSTEVTNREYAEFIQATNRRTPENWQDGKPPAGQENFPVTYVSNFDAKDFATWISKRDNTNCQLPTEEEWEYAARSGSQENIYPWGRDWILGRANIDSGVVKEVGTSGDETSVGKIKDMMGNVWEWTATTFRYYPGFPKEDENPDSKANIFPVVRGASFASTKDQIKNKHLLLTHRQGWAGDSKFAYLGFRLVCHP